MASRSTNTMQEALQKMMRDLADMKTLGDADLPFVVELETSIINYFKRPVDELRAEGQLPPADPNGGMPPGAMPAAPPSMGMPAGADVGGGFMAGPKAPSTDELSRVLGGVQ